MSVAPGAALPYQIKTPCRRQKLQATINTHHVQHQQQQQKLRSSERYNTLHRQDIRQTTRPHRRHMASAIRLRSPLMGYHPTVNVHQVQELQHYHRSIEQSSTTVDETIRAHIIDAARRIPSPPDLHSYAQCPTDHAPTSTKVMGNHRTSCILKQ